MNKGWINNNVANYDDNIFQREVEKRAKEIKEDFEELGIEKLYRYCAELELKEKLE